MAIAMGMVLHGFNLGAFITVCFTNLGPRSYRFGVFNHAKSPFFQNHIFSSVFFLCNLLLLGHAKSMATIDLNTFLDIHYG